MVLLENQTKISFITGDQPVVNMLDPRTTNDINFTIRCRRGLRWC